MGIFVMLRRLRLPGGSNKFCDYTTCTAKVIRYRKTVWGGYVHGTFCKCYMCLAQIVPTSLLFLELIEASGKGVKVIVVIASASASRRCSWHSR